MQESQLRKSGLHVKHGLQHTILTMPSLYYALLNPNSFAGMLLTDIIFYVPYIKLLLYIISHLISQPAMIDAYNKMANGYNCGTVLYMLMQYHKP